MRIEWKEVENGVAFKEEDNSDKTPSYLLPHCSFLHKQDVQNNFWIIQTSNNTATNRIICEYQIKITLTKRSHICFVVTVHFFINWTCKITFGRRLAALSKRRECK
ncbi:hypothetical protein U1Q18_020628 [Sarracenia purpurea var. burkii]